MRLSRHLSSRLSGGEHVARKKKFQPQFFASKRPFSYILSEAGKQEPKRVILFELTAPDFGHFQGTVAIHMSVDPQLSKCGASAANVVGCDDNVRLAVNSIWRVCFTAQSTFQRRLSKPFEPFQIA